MKRTIDYYYCLNSPWSYLGNQRLAKAAISQSAGIVYKPVKLADVFKDSGGLPLAKRPKQRQAYRLVELERWRKFLGIPLNLEPRHFPANEDLAARVVIAADLMGWNPGKLTQAFMRAVWAEERDIADEDTIYEIASETGHDGIALMDKAGTADVYVRYDENTINAKEVGVFGVPSYVLGGEIFWGQDRIDFLERALAK